MVAQDPHYLGVVAGFFEDLLYHARLVGGPSPLVHMDLPGMDYVAYQVDLVSVVVIQEIHEHPGLAMPATQMYVGYADGAMSLCLRHRTYLLIRVNR